MTERGSESAPFRLKWLRPLFPASPPFDRRDIGIPRSNSPRGRKFNYSRFFCSSQLIMGLFYGPN